jgi:pimeloyl-ACP methyl ester carboxylesterase
MNEKFIQLGNPNGKKILLAHANAYTPDMYQYLVLLLGDHCVIAPRHRPLWQKNADEIKDWDIFCKDLIAFMDEHKISNVDAIGHSLGAVSIWKASWKRPDLFNKIILVDPVVIPENLVNWMRFVPYKIKQRLRPIIKIASLRKNKWSSREEAHAHLGSKSVFKRFVPQIFDTYIQSGIIPDGHGMFTLAFPREWEARIYSSPENTWKFMGKIDKQIHIIRAEHSNVINDETWQKMKVINNKNNYIFMPNVGHLIPFEQPKALADIILQIL